MGHSEPQDFPKDIIAQVRDGLAHYYDQAYLLQHPLLERLQLLPGPEAPVAVQELRRLLARAVQDLRPRPDTPLSDPAWRPYTVLHRRFILGKDLADVEKELALGRRQVLREQRKGLEAIALALWQSRRRQEDGNGNGDDSPLLQEISRVAADRQGIDARQVLNSALAPVQALAQSYSVNLQQADTCTSAHVICNPSLLKQLMVAVLSFSVRSVSGGSVSISLTRNRRHTFLTCHAVNPGSLAASTLREVPGNIAALAAAQRVRASVENSANGFTIRIAITNPDEEQLIAIVEDNEDAVRLFSRYLSGRGYRIVGISDSKQALTRITQLMPDAILLDVMMSEVDGWEILQQLKANPQLSGIPVAICSVLDEPELALSIGADAYLKKPVRSAQLLDCLARLLDR